MKSRLVFLAGLTACGGPVRSSGSDASAGRTEADVQRFDAAGGGKADAGGGGKADGGGMVDAGGAGIADAAGGGGTPDAAGGGGAPDAQPAPTCSGTEGFLTGTDFTLPRGY